MLLSIFILLFKSIIAVVIITSQNICLVVLALKHSYVSFLTIPIYTSIWYQTKTDLYK